MDRSTIDLRSIENWQTIKVFDKDANDAWLQTSSWSAHTAAINQVFLIAVDILSSNLSFILEKINSASGAQSQVDWAHPEFGQVLKLRNISYKLPNIIYFPLIFSFIATTRLLLRKGSSSFLFLQRRTGAGILLGRPLSPDLGRGGPAGPAAQVSGGAPALILLASCV